MRQDAAPGAVAAARPVGRSDQHGTGAALEGDGGAFGETAPVGVAGNDDAAVPTSRSVAGRSAGPTAIAS